MIEPEDQSVEWEKVWAALDNPAWDFRTVDGIAKETELRSDVVEQVLVMHQSWIRQTVSQDRRVIYTLKSRPKKLREIVADIQLLASR